MCKIIKITSFETLQNDEIPDRKPGFIRQATLNHCLILLTSTDTGNDKEHKVDHRHHQKKIQ